ncbi:hypothetical protein Trydic_g3978 [Trypoxylus dichotomus]
MYISSPVHSESQYDHQVFDLRSPGADASLEDGDFPLCIRGLQSVEGCLETAVDYPGVPGSHEDANVVQVHHQLDVRGLNGVGRRWFLSK